MRITWALGIKRIKDLFKILVLLNNRLLIILMMSKQKANENDFQKDGVQVGSANTVNFTGGSLFSICK